MIVANRVQTRVLEEASGSSQDQLMERAGLGCFLALKRIISKPSRTLVVCGKGNNGGDGFVIARLAQEAGYHVTCLLVAPEENFNELCAKKLDGARKAGVQVQTLSELSQVESFLSRYEVIVDCIFGTGFIGVLPDQIRSLVSLLNVSDAFKFSVDIPSGIDCDTGLGDSTCFEPDHIAVVGVSKPFLFQNLVVQRNWKWELVDIGLSESAAPFAKFATLVGPDDLSLLERAKDSNKGRNGHVLIVAGSDCYRGAAVLATLGALRAGAGLVTVAGIEPVLAAVASQIPEAILLPLEAEGGSIAASSARTVLDQSARFSSAVFGPGLTQSSSVIDFFGALWDQWKIPTILDADALNLLAKGVRPPSSLKMITPHPGEAARLLSCTSEVVQIDRFGAVTSLGQEFGCSVILKGAYSLAYEGGEIKINSFGNSGMATGGMGDVLAGVAGALIGEPLAASKSMALHGLAGDLAQKEIGNIGYSASELAHFLPRARSILTKQKERENL